MEPAAGDAPGRCSHVSLRWPRTYHDFPVARDRPAKERTLRAAIAVDADHVAAVGAALSEAAIAGRAGAAGAAVGGLVRAAVAGHANLIGRADRGAISAVERIGLRVRAHQAALPGIRRTAGDA